MIQVKGKSYGQINCIDGWRHKGGCFMCVFFFKVFACFHISLLVNHTLFEDKETNISNRVIAYSSKLKQTYFAR